ncbi:MAG: hypothetical protein AB1767_02520 [Bacillota bacterium]
MSECERSVFLGRQGSLITGAAIGFAESGAQEAHQEFGCAKLLQGRGMPCSR